MSRRGNNEGTISKRADGRWEARLSLPNGKRKSFYGKTRAEVARKLSEARHDQDRGLPALNERQTLAQYLETWMAKMQHTVKPRTHVRYQQHLLHLPMDLKRTPIVRITPQQIQAFYSDLLDQGLSTTTVHSLHTVLHHALGDALRLGIVQRNVASLIDPPRPRRTEMQVLTPDQAILFLTACKGERFEALFILAITTGMREGELLGLSWRDVDLEAGVISIRRTLYYLNKQFVFDEPKTTHSWRSIRLTTLAIEALRAHEQRQIEIRARYNKIWDNTSDLVFPTHLGGPFNFANLIFFEFQPLLKKAGLPRIRFHDLRHTAATLLLKEGVHPKIVSEMLGHSQVSITLDRYSHVLPDMQNAAVQAMEKTLQFPPLSSELSSKETGTKPETSSEEE